MYLHESDALHVLHVAAAMVLVGHTFYAFAAAPETRKRVLIWTGAASLVMLATGLHMWHEHGYDPVGWLVVKVVCWLGLSALAGIGYRRRGKAGLLIAVALFLIVTAVTMVYLKPF
jgi:hypothetical protein